MENLSILKEVSQELKLKTKTSMVRHHLLVNCEVTRINVKTIGLLSAAWQYDRQYEVTHYNIIIITLT